MIKLYSSNIQDPNQLRELRLKENSIEGVIQSTETQGKFWPFVIDPPEDLSTFKIDSIYDFERIPQHKLKVKLTSRNIENPKCQVAKQITRKSEIRK